MAVIRTVTSATPYEKDGNVVRWDVEIKYEDCEEDTYFTSSSSNSINSRGISDALGNREEVFEEKSKEEWTLAEITALARTDHWDKVFALQYDSVITNPPVVPAPDKAFELPAV